MGNSGLILEGGGSKEIRYVLIYTCKKFTKICVEKEKNLEEFSILYINAREAYKYKQIEVRSKIVRKIGKIKSCDVKLSSLERL